MSTSKNRSFGQGVKILAFWPIWAIWPITGLTSPNTYYGQRLKTDQVPSNTTHSFINHFTQGSAWRLKTDIPNESPTHYIQPYTIKNSDLVMIVKVEILTTHSVLYHEVRA